MDRWIDAFLHHLRLERGRAENTIRAYGHDLAKFAAFAAEHDASIDPDAEGELAALRPEVISAFMVELGREGLSARSAARHLTAIRVFCRFLVNEGHLPTNPTSLMVGPQAGERLPAVLDAEEVVRLLGVPIADAQEPTFRPLEALGGVLGHRPANGD